MQAASLPDIICFSSSDWEGSWGSRQQVMSRFAQRGYRVLFVEQMAGLEHFYKYGDLRRRRWQGWREGLREIQPNLWLVAPPPLLPGRYFARPIADCNAWLVLHWIRRYRQVPKPESSLIWVYKPEHVRLLRFLSDPMVVYHCIDEFTVGAGGRKKQTIVDMENELLTRADLVFANSATTYERKRRLNPNTYRIPSAADVTHFAQALDPALAAHPAIAHLPRPRMGYLGHVNERLDYGLLEDLARQMPSGSLVFAGSTYPWPEDAPALRPLRELPNVHFLGAFPFSQVPALLKGMDVCLLPYLIDEHGYYRSPLKLYEYLAAGKPVVATDHPEAKELGDVVYRAVSKEEFVPLVAQALGQDNEERRQQRLAVARQNSWECRVDDMERIMCAVLGWPSCVE